MATQNGINYAKGVNPTSDNVVPAGTIGGRERVHTENFTFAGEAAGEVIRLGRKMRKGAIITGIEVQNAALGAGVTYRIGDSNDDDRYKTDIAAATAAVNTALNIAGLHYVVGTNSGDDIIQLLTAGGAATGLVKVTIRYTED